MVLDGVWKFPRIVYITGRLANTDTLSASQNEFI